MFTDFRIFLIICVAASLVHRAPAAGQTAGIEGRDREADLEADSGRAAGRVAAEPSAETDLARANAEIDRLKAALAGLRDMLVRERRNSHYNMGYVYKVCRQYERAEQEFLKALEIDPEDPGIHFNLGVLYDDDLKNRVKARLHYEKFLELAPHDPDAPAVREWLAGL